MPDGAGRSSATPASPPSSRASRGRGGSTPRRSAGRSTGRTALLSPFDRLIHDRARRADLFDFEYVLEMYKPAAKRRWGYFALPILHHDRLVGKLDATADRKAGVLRRERRPRGRPLHARDHATASTTRSRRSRRGSGYGRLRGVAVSRRGPGPGWHDGRRADRPPARIECPPAGSVAACLAAILEIDVAEVPVPAADIRSPGPSGATGSRSAAWASSRSPIRALRLARPLARGPARGRRRRTGRRGRVRRAAGRRVAPARTAPRRSATSRPATSSPRPTSRSGRHRRERRAAALRKRRGDRHRARRRGPDGPGRARRRARRPRPGGRPLLRRPRDVLERPRPRPRPDARSRPRCSTP